ncbi:hypothetical protein Dsin_016911 [Dipteronia sinensis]|uniref:Reverse transcriptase domain-containing protein n=1 Tax=Dipteronia sinensis TaxID=43782 RepID=A0AAE0ADZ8_9ROSI|nr:hypothetical protein Dsin_016911 [Dipteronia sinensis]
MDRSNYGLYLFYNSLFLVNGRPVCKVQPSRGLRQGCPISPYLFLLCVEALSCLIMSAEKNGRGLGVRCSRGGLLISHMFFTDDNNLFCRASRECSSSIQDILMVYEFGSGQHINLQNCKITFSPNVIANTKSVIQNLLGIPAGAKQDQYLGLHSMMGKNKRVLFNAIKERVWKKLRGWKDSFFSFGGKEMLIKAVAQAIPSYAMSIFQLPVGLCKDLSAVFSKFWWRSEEGNKKISWVKWVAFCHPKSQDGLGFKDLLSFNQSLLAKQAWRILSCRHSLVARLLKAKYFKNGEFLMASAKNGCSHIWRSILWGRSLLAKGLR